MKKGFTMPEILVAVLIVTILVTMAVPMYERAVEKSRIAEVSATLKRMSESKLRVMDDRNMADYSSGDLSLSQLDSSIKNTSDFSYRLYPESFPNAVCAVRLQGDNRGTSFLYLGETAAQYCDDSSATQYSSSVCEAYRSLGRKLFCKNATGVDSCDAYSMDHVNIGTCSTR